MDVQTLFHFLFLELPGYYQEKNLLILGHDIQMRL